MEKGAGRDGTEGKGRRGKEGKGKRKGKWKGKESIEVEKGGGSGMIIGEREGGREG